MRRRAVALLFCLAAALDGGLARAEAVDAATRSTARRLGAEGLTLYDKGQYEQALEKFRVANQLVPAPTLGVRAARCLEKLGRLVEASEAYLDVTRQELERGALAVQRKAQAEALSEREKLLPRIPSLLVRLSGPVGTGVKVSVDGAEMPDAMIGEKRSIDPGTHAVEARRGEQKFPQSITITERQAAEVTIELPPLPKAPPKPPPPTSSQRTLGFVGIGVGIAGVAVGTGAGVVALVQHGSLADKCGETRVCPPSEESAVQANDLMRTASTVGFVVGAVGLAVGIPLLLTAPHPARDAAPSATLLVSPAGASVAGRF